MELQTDRLYIRDLREDDWRKMKALFIDFNKSEYAAYDRPLPTEDAETEDLTKQFVESGGFFTVCLVDNSQMIGYVCFHKAEDKFDLGYCFHSAFHLRGYAYESIKALIAYYVQEYSATVFTAGTAIANMPSRRLQEKLGFQCVSTEYLSFNGEPSFEGGNYILNVQKNCSGSLPD